MPLITPELRQQNQGKFLNAYDFQDNSQILQIINIESKPKNVMGNMVEANHYTFIEPRSGQEKIIHNDSQKLFQAFDKLKVEANDLVQITTFRKQGSQGQEYLEWNVQKVEEKNSPKLTPESLEEEEKEEINPDDIPF